MYQALYRKYRPQTFDQVVAQPGITRTLKNQVQSGQLSHAYLFTGSRGTGKTSCAKIMAKAVNCQNPQNGNPCNQCPACRSINRGSCMDVLEIDAASNNGVDQVRSLRDEAVYLPAEVRYRVYIVDEVHMLSLSAFNALLKLIEEPPAHLIFILATTELQKVPATILSRCQRFSFRRISPEDVAAQLQAVAAQEQIQLEPEAARILGRMADGALRDGLSLLDQCATAAQGPVTAQGVYRCLGLAGTQQAAAILDAIARRDTPAALALYDRLYGEGKDVADRLDEVCALARDLLVLHTAPEAGLAMLSGVSTTQEAQALQGKLSTGELVDIIGQIQATAAGLTRAGKTRMAGELCLIRLCRPELNLGPEAMNARLTKLEAAVAAGVRPAEQPPAGQLPPEQPTAKHPPAEELPVEQPPAEPDFWPALVEGLLPKLNPADRGFFAPTLVTGRWVENRLQLDCSATYVYDRLNRPELLRQIGQAAGERLGRPVQVVPVDGQARPKQNENLQALLNFGRQHSDIVKIK